MRFGGIRLEVFAFVAVIGIAGAATLASAATEEQEVTIKTSARTAILIDADGGSVLLDKNADERVAPASLTKLMTAEIVFNELKSGRLKLDTEYEISEHAWRTGGAPSHGSAMFAAIHSRVRVEDLLRGMIIFSGNDAAIALAEGISGSEAKFAQKMNARARELGLTNSNFTNASGFPDPTLYMSARDLALLGRHIIRTYPEYYPIYGEPEFTWNKIRQHNRNPLIGMDIGADGMKTGTTKEAGFNLVGSALQNGTRLIVVITGTKSEKERADEGKKLLEWGFHNFETRLLFSEGQYVADARTFGGDRWSVPLIAPRPIKIMVPRNVKEIIRARVSYQGPVRVPVKEGQQIGVLKVWRNDNMAIEVPLNASESVGPGNIPGRAFDAATEFVIGLFRAGIERL